MGTTTTASLCKCPDLTGCKASASVKRRLGTLVAPKVGQERGFQRPGNIDFEGCGSTQQTPIEHNGWASALAGFLDDARMVGENGGPCSTAFELAKALSAFLQRLGTRVN